MKRLIFTYILLVLGSTITCNAEIPADISFLVVDLKYNTQDRVKICEVQQGLGSTFEGIKYLSEKKGVMGKLFCDCLSLYHNRFWSVKQRVISEYYNQFDSHITHKKYSDFDSMLKSKSFNKKTKKAVKDPYCIQDYRGVLINHYYVMDSQKLQKYPAVLVLNRAFLGTFGEDPYTDKFNMNTLFDGPEALAELRPNWNLYPKEYSIELVDTILSEITSELLVIKPRSGLQGKGVIILERKSLDSTLQYIFSGSKELKNDPDKAYHHWFVDQHSDFIVEEFYPSDPVVASQLDNNPYDGTMRVAVVLAYTNHNIEMHFLSYHWKLAKMPLNGDANLTDKHKSFSQSKVHYCEVEAEVCQAVEQQLREGLPLLYEKLLQQ